MKINYFKGEFSLKVESIIMEENWVLLTEATNDVEAEIICGFLKDNDIPAKTADSSPYAGAMRVIGGLAYEVNILVPEPFLEEAKKMLDTLEESL